MSDAPIQHAAPVACGRQLGVIAAVTVTYVILVAGFVSTRGVREAGIYGALMAILMTLTYVAHRRLGFSVGLLWCLSAWGGAHVTGGLVATPDGWPTDGGPLVYNLWILPGILRYDQVVHAFGFGVSTWLWWQCLRSAIARHTAVWPTPTSTFMVVCAAGGMGLGALNEVIEFAATRVLPETNVGDYPNTGWDLVANLAGASAAALLIGWRGSSAGKAA